jgi:tol-pal system beta propeller repeat protein TolB
LHPVAGNRRDRRRFAVHAAVVALCLCALGGGAVPAAAQDAEVYLEVQKWDYYRVPLVIEDFDDSDLAGRGLGPLRLSTGARIEDLLAQDLSLTDAFQVIREGRGELVDPNYRIDTGGRLVERPPQARVAAQLRWRDGSVELRARLLDTGSGQEIFSSGCGLTTPAAPLVPERWAVHRLADDITRYLTGAPGCAATRIAFVRAGAAGKDIFLIDWDGSGEARLTRWDSIAISPAWHPGQGRIACTSYDKGQPRLVAVDVATGTATTISTASMPSAPAYSRDGKQIAFCSTETGDAEIYIARSDGSQPRRATFNPGIDTAPSWSPSGDRIVFTSDRCGKPQLFLMDADGTDVQQLTFTGDWNDSADWSPLSARIVHACLIDGKFELALISPAGGEWRRLTIGGGCENPRWAPDGRHVVFARSQGGARNLWILDVQSGGLRQLTASREPSYNPAWSGIARER